MPRSLRRLTSQSLLHCRPRLLPLVLALALLRPSAGPAQPAPDVETQTRIARATCDQAISAQRWAEALPACQAVLKAAEKTLGPKDESVAFWLNRVGLAHYHLGRYPDAELHLQRGLRIRETTLGPEHPDVATSLNNLGLLYEAQSRYALAESLYRRSLSIHEKLPWPGHDEVVTVLNNLAGMYRDEGRYSDADQLCRRSLNIAIQMYGAEHPNVAKSLDSLAWLYEAQGRYVEAEKMYLRSLSIREKVLDQSHPDIAIPLNNLALLYLDQRRYAEAEPLLIRSASIWGSSLGQEHPLFGTSLANAAGLYFVQGRYADAEKLLLRSLRIRERSLGPSHPDVALVLNNLAAVYINQGLYTEATSALRRALHGLEQSLSHDHQYIATTIQRMAQLSHVQGHYVAAEHEYQKSLRIFRKVLRPEHPDVAAALNNLAAFYIDNHEPRQALEPLQMLIESSLNRNGSLHELSVQAFQQLSTVLQHLGHQREAGKLFARFLGELSKVTVAGQSTNIDVSSRLLGRALFHFWLERHFDEVERIAAQLGDLALAKAEPMASVLQRMQAQLAAVPAAERKRLIARAAFAKGRDDAHAMGLFDRGLEAAAQGLTAEAVRSLLDGLYLGEAHLRRQKSVRAVAEWLGRQQPYLNLIFELARTQPQDLDVLRLAWTAALLTKGRTLDAETRALRVLHDPKVALQNPRTFKMLNEVSNAYRREALQPKPGGELHTLGRQRDDMQHSLSLSMDLARIEVLPEPFEIVRAVAAKLPKDGVLVDFIEYVPPQLGKEEPEARYLALLMFPSAEGNEPRLQLLDLGEVKAHGPRIAELLKALRDPSSQPQKAARAVYDALLDPVRKAAGTATQLWLVPDGALNLIPFDALHDGQGYVLDSPLRIRYLASGRDLVFSFGASSAQPPLVLGNPALHAATAPSAPTAPASSAPKTAAVSLAKKQRGSDARGGSLFDALPDLRDLPDAEQEARTVAAQLQVAALLGTQASEPALRGKIARGQVPRILHLAMHGVFPDDLLGTTAFGARARSVPVPFAPGVLPPPSAAPAPPPAAADVSPAIDEPMLRSALILAGAAKARDASDAKSDGILTADEARELPLQGAELVVLSACQTALGSIRAGDGVYGLRRAFLAAGAEAVVASLWRVADRQTHSLMNKYYERIITQRTPRITAMRDAMREIKKTNPHPYYWAPFIAIGRDAPIRPLDLRTAQQP